MAPVEARVLEALRLWSRDEFRVARGLYADDVADLLERTVWVSAEFYHFIDLMSPLKLTTYNSWRLTS